MTACGFAGRAMRMPSEGTPKLPTASAVVRPTLLPLPPMPVVLVAGFFLEPQDALAHRINGFIANLSVPTKEAKVQCMECPFGAACDHTNVTWVPHPTVGE